MLHLEIQKRDTSKKSKNYVKEGFVPGILYGPKIESVSVLVDYKKFSKMYKDAGKTTLIALDFKSEESEGNNTVVIKSVQANPVTGQFYHVDFYQLPMDKEIEITVPILSINEAPAVKEQGGILVNNLHEIHIKALPNKLIHEITVDISSLINIDDSILVKDLIIIKGVEVLADVEEVVFNISAPREEEPEEVEETEEEVIDGIKTEGEEKREEEVEEGGDIASSDKKEETPKQEGEKGEDAKK